ncbi:DUF1768-domain-containing protein [Artomyces pyxidatus]|uniref:DUF1768-domain-containing protein n=1 Tax=Artomyces pyxidatus TaxID=48021 RepID=A0ACB8SJ27_9AGAM|nr:DUF1768-domain-containing protein [Artomyces pyxidatus]
MSFVEQIVLTVNMGQEPSRTRTDDSAMDVDEEVHVSSPRERTSPRRHEHRRGRSSTMSGPEPPILFYHRGHPFFEFTNFSEHSIIHHSLVYPTAEHLFQAYKFFQTRPDLAEEIRRLPSARAARTEAGRWREYQRSDWFEINVDIMESILEKKFTQHQHLRFMLLSTGTRELIEDSPDDLFWGIGSDKSGRNELGKALMRVRTRLNPSAQ